jgi:hypothetical protein
MFAGYLAKFMLHCKWKKNDGFKMFMKYAGNLYSGVEKSDYVPQEAKRFKHIVSFNFLLYFTLFVVQILSSVIKSDNISGLGIGTIVSSMQYVV